MFSIANGIEAESQSVNGSGYAGLHTGVQLRIVALIKPKPLNEAINRIRSDHQKVYREVIKNSKDSNERKMEMEECMYMYIIRISLLYYQ